MKEVTGVRHAHECRRRFLCGDEFVHCGGIHDFIKDALDAIEKQTVRKQIVEINDVVQGNRKATVVLRPVHLHTLADLLHPPEGVDTGREREAFAHRLALGAPGAV